MVRYTASILSLNTSLDDSRSDKTGPTAWRWQISWGETKTKDSIVLITKSFFV